MSGCVCRKIGINTRLVKNTMALCHPVNFEMTHILKKLHVCIKIAIHTNIIIVIIIIIIIHNSNLIILGTRLRTKTNLIARHYK